MRKLHIVPCETPHQDAAHQWQGRYSARPAYLDAIAARIAANEVRTSQTRTRRFAAGVLVSLVLGAALVALGSILVAHIDWRCSQITLICNT